MELRTVRRFAKGTCQSAAVAAALIAAAPAWAQAPAEGTAENAPAATPSGGAPSQFKSLRIVGTRLVREADEEAGIMPFNEPKGFDVSLIGELPVPALSVKSVSLRRAVADNGEDLVADNDERRALNAPRLSNDRVSVVFECPLRVPGEEAKGVKELSGTLIYVEAKGNKEVNLGTIALRSGAEGKIMELRIESFGKYGWDRDRNSVSELRISLTTKFDAIKDLKLLDASGNPISIEQPNERNRRFVRSSNTKRLPCGAEVMRRGPGRFRRGGGVAEDYVEITLTHAGELPPEAKILLEMYDDLQEHTVPFKIGNFDLLGRPMK
jgi:hypothetical protein